MVGRNRGLRAIVEQRLQTLVEQRQPMLDADMTLAGRDCLVEDVVTGHTAEQFAITTAETFDAVGRQKNFAHRQQDDLVAVAGRELAHRIEGADRLQRVAEQIEAQRLGRARREEIEQIRHGPRTRRAP